MPILTGFRSLLRRVARDRRGTAGVVIVATLPVTLFVAGMVIDLGRVMVARSELQTSLDDAALAVGATSNATSAKGVPGTCDNNKGDYLPSLATKYLNANYLSSIGTLSPVQVCVTSDGTTVMLNATVTVPMMVMSVFGFHTASASSTNRILRTSGGMEVALILDNTGSMGENTTDGVEAMVAVQQASFNLVNAMWGQTPSSSAISPAPAALPALWVGIVPFAAEINVANTATNASLSNTIVEVMGSDATVRIKDIVSTTSTDYQHPMCTYNGTWTPATNDYIDPMDLIHLAQDLCAQYVTGVDSTTGAQTLSAGFQNLYLADYYNSNGGMGWSGCVEARVTEGDTSSTPYWDSNAKATNPAPSTYDHEFATTGIVPKTAPDPEYLWHIYRGPSDAGRNANYLPNPFLPNTANFTSKYYSNTAAPVAKTYQSKKKPYSYDRVTAYKYYPRVLLAVQSCGTDSTCKSPGAITYQLGGSTVLGQSVGPSENYYWTPPGSGPNGNCIGQNVLPLTNTYSDVASAINAMTPGGYTVGDVAWGWGARVLSNNPPFPESKTIEASLPDIPAGSWRHVVVFMTDGDQNVVNNSYTAYTEAVNICPGAAWCTGSPDSGAPPWAALEDNNSILNSTLVAVPGWSSAPNPACGYSTNSTGTSDDYQIMCRIYKECSYLRSQGYYIYTVLFSHNTNETSLDEAVMMQQCTADGHGNVDTTKFFNVPTASAISSAFAAIGTQLNSLRIEE